MLERTGPSLKSCSLQRVLPKPAPTTKRSHKLHTGFWQHGGLAIEIASIWHTRVRRSASDIDSTKLASPSPPTGLVASSFLLDFLYPQATRKLLWRLYPGLARLQDGEKASSATSKKRGFTSASSLPSLSPSSAPAVEPVPQSHEAFPQPSPARHLQRSMRKFDGSHATRTSEVAHAEPVYTATATQLQTKFTGPLDDLADLLARQDGQHYQEIWDLYCKLDEKDRPMFQRDMVLYLSKSHGIVETGRAISLFRQVSAANWDNDLLAAGVLGLVRSGDLKHAADTLTVGLESKGLTGGFEYILADAITHRNWPVLIGSWLRLYDARGQPDFNNFLEHFIPERFQSIPQLDSLFFSFEKYLAGDGERSVRAINMYDTSRHGLAALRRKLAQLAILQPCQPRPAAAILELLGDSGLYHDYLLCVLEQWEKTELQANVTWLAEIYKTYGDMAGAEPSVQLLRGMFNLFYPSNVAGLEQVYRDWHRTWGGLDQWGYEKFLKFYAGAGDVKAVRDLWKRYVADYPRVLQRPKAFRSTMNVYAQVGDKASAEKELQTMTKKYGVQPDLDTWNALLKCYVKTDNYEQVVACFEEICKIHRPDSFTYAHVMAMAAKKGDIEATLAFFSRSRKDRVPISKEMTMSLVMAYCRNDRLLIAERILMELAERKVTSTAIWNQLIYFNGIQGKLTKCYELLQSMKNYDVPWDHQTHEFLLQALVRVNQVQPAYRLLRSAWKEKMFPVGPEHFAIVMAGAVRTGELKLVEIIASQLDRAGSLRNLNVQTALADASFQRAPSSPRTRELGKEFINHMQSLLDGRGTQGRANGAVSSVAGDLRYLRQQTKSIGQAVRLLVELRDFASAEKLVNLYAKVFHRYKGSEPFPPKVISALMLGYLNDGQYEQVHKLWSRSWESVLARSKRPNTEGIYAAHQYDVSRPISVVAKAFLEQKDGKGLLECIRQVTSAGFKLTRNNWNVVIQYLAKLGQWEPAMEWCETLMMSRWRGWGNAKRTLQERRQMKNTRVLQASKAAVLSLQHHWLKLRTLSAWSPVVSVKLREIEKRFPRLHYAFSTAEYEHLAIAWEGGGKKSLTRGAEEMLKTFEHRELRGMERGLEKRRRRALVRRAKKMRRKRAQEAVTIMIP